MVSFIDFIILLTPGLSGIGMNRVCPVQSSAGVDNPARPPAWVFGVVWPVLYILIGLAWIQARRRLPILLVDGLFGGLTGLLVMWQFLWGCKDDRQSALYVLVAALTRALGAALACTRVCMWCALSMCLVVGWLVLATLLNYTSVERAL